MGYDPKGKILLTCVSDEEDCGINGTKFLIEQGIIKGNPGDLGVCMEPSRCRVLTRHCGGATIKVTYESESGDTSMPHKSVDALEKSIKAINRLDKLAAKGNYNGEMGVWSLLSITMMNSGNISNMYPSKNELIIDRRLLLGENLEEAHNDIKAILDQLKEENPLNDYKYKILGDYPSLIVDDYGEITIALQAFKDITGKETSIYKIGGGSDASAIVEKAGIPMPNFGVRNDVEESTHENEKLFLEDYFTFIIESFLCNLQTFFHSLFFAIK